MSFWVYPCVSVRGVTTVSVLVRRPGTVTLNRNSRSVNIGGIRSYCVSDIQTGLAGRVQVTRWSSRPNRRPRRKSLARRWCSRVQTGTPPSESMAGIMKEQ